MKDLNEEDYDPNNEGLVISKQKRARKDILDPTDLGLNVNGPQVEHNVLDTVMADTQNKEDVLSKNLQMAGAATQTRQSL